MKFMLSMLLSAAAFSAWCEVVSEPLCRFESAADLARWSLRSQGTDASAAIQKSSAETGGGAVELFLPKCNQWPALHSDSARLPSVDWENYDFLAADVQNLMPYRDVIKVELRFFDKENRRILWRHFFDLKPGMNRIRLPYGEDLKTCRFGEIYLYTDRPVKDSRVVISNLRLETREKAEKQAELAELAASLTQPKYSALAPGAPIAEAVALRERCTAFRKRYAQAPDDFPALLAALKSGRALRNELAALKTKLDAAAFAASGTPELAFGWANGIDRIYRDDMPFPGTIGGNGTLELAGNEAEPIQLVLVAKEELKDVTVQVGSLLDARGNEIPASAVSAFPVGYVNIAHAGYYAERTGWTPDPILNYLRGFSLEKGKMQPIWIEVAAPAGQSAGIYHGEVTVSAAGRKLMTTALSVRVRDFTLPTKGNLRLSITVRFDDGAFDALYGDGNPATVKEFRRYLAGELDYAALSANAKAMAGMMMKFEKEIAAHRIPVDTMFRNGPIPEDDMRRLLSGRNTLVNLFAVDKHNSPEQVMNWMDQLAPVLTKNNWFDNSYIYSYDDLTPDQLNLLHKTFLPVKKKYPKVKILTNAFDYSLGTETGLNDIVDIWVPLIREYMGSPETVKAARAAGKEVWWYVCCFPSPPIANWLLESRPTGTRLLMGMMPYKFDVEGFLHWGVIRWKGNRTVKDASGKSVTRELYWPERLKGGPLTNNDGRAFTYFNGDGMLFYPGETGPVSSQRAKLIRDGLEDYEYLKLLEAAVRSAEKGERNCPPELLKQARQALQVPAAICRAEHLYAAEGTDIVNYRARIADLIEAIQQSGRK